MIEVLPTYPLGRRVTHHFLATAVQETNLGGLLTEWAGGSIRFEVHYFPSGTEVPDDQVSFGIWLCLEGYEPEFTTVLRMFNVAGQGTLELPPHSKPMFVRAFVMRTPVRIQSFQAH